MSDRKNTGYCDHCGKWRVLDAFWNPNRTQFVLLCDKDYRAAKSRIGK